MPEIPGDPVEVEKLVRGLVAQKFTGMEGVPSVLPHRLYIDSEGQAIKLMGYKHPATNRMEYRVLLVDFDNFEDTEDGCDDDPVYNLVYTLKLVVSHEDERPDNTTSTDDFARIAITLRARVLADRNFGGYDRLRCENLQPQDTTMFERDEETGVYGHTGIYSLKVRVTPLG